MAKQNVKDRLAESRGMERYETERKMDKKKKKSSGKKRFHFGEDHSAQANMPTKVVMMQYPSAFDGVEGYYDDTLAGIDYQIDSDQRTVRKGANKVERY